MAMVMGTIMEMTMTTAMHTIMTTHMGKVKAMRTLLPQWRSAASASTHWAW